MYCEDSGGDMSPLYVPRKRKSALSQSKGGLSCSAVRHTPDQNCELDPITNPKDDKPRPNNAAKVKRTFSRKRYEELQSVSFGAVDYPTTSCSVRLTDLGSMIPPTARLPPRLMAKDMWPQGAEADREQAKPQDQDWNSSTDQGPDTWGPGTDRQQEELWNSSRDQAVHPSQDQAWDSAGDSSHHGKADQAWMRAQSRGAEEGWAAGRGHVQNQTWNPGRDPEAAGRGQDQVYRDQDRDRGPVWRPDLNMKKVERVETKRGSSANNLQSSSNGDVASEGSSAQPGEEHKPLVLSIKKEPPSYPSGSQEERWHLQIVAKGRVPCPKCKSVSRKTVEGLKKHMENCRLQPFTCQHCGKQLKSSTGMKYHIMADHSQLPSSDDTKDLDNRVVKDKLRKILKRLGKLKCSQEGCNAAFSSIMGYLYHMKKCGKEESELEKMLLSCSHCGKNYKSKAGLEYHLKSEHAPTPEKSEEAEALRAQQEADPERTASGRVQRASAQVANFQLAEIANNDLPKDWPKRKFQSDLVPDDKKLKYARPGLPTFSQEVLRKWKNEVKLQKKVPCPNQGCGSTYTSVSGLKAHLGLCTRGDFEVGKYRCLICNKEFNSESGVKYHINSIHSQEWFVTNKKAFKKFEKFLKNQPKEFAPNTDKQFLDQYHQNHLQQHHHHHHHCPHQQQHHHHHHHHHQQHQFQHQGLQQPLQPLHHLPYLHPQQQDLPPQVDPQLQQPVLQYTPLEPPPGPLWVELDSREVEPGPEQAPIEMECKEDGILVEEKHQERGRLVGRHKDCFAFSGGNGGEAQADQWNLKQPLGVGVRANVRKRQKNI